MRRVATRAAAAIVLAGCAASHAAPDAGGARDAFARDAFARDASEAPLEACSTEPFVPGDSLDLADLCRFAEEPRVESSRGGYATRSLRPR